MNKWLAVLLLLAGGAAVVVTLLFAFGAFDSPNAGNPHIAMNAINSIVKAATK